MNALLTGFKALGPVKLAALGAVGLGMLALFALLALSRGAPPNALLYGNLGLAEAARMTAELHAEHIPYRLAAGGHAIYVADPEVPRARLLLAAKGLPKSGSVGYEIFDHLNGLTTSQFVENIDAKRALEGELERTIDQIDGVRASRVNLVLPSRAPFAAERQPAQASVLLTMQGAAGLDREGVQAILNLVAAAVPGLKPDHIAIVDSRGESLTRAGQPAGAIGRAQTAEAVRAAVAARLSRAVEAMLDQSLGPNGARATANVAMDFDQVHQTTDRYDPNGQVALSEQSIDSSSTNSRARKTVTVRNKLPGASAAAGPANGSTSKKHEETTNYNISHTVRTLVHDQPAITHISIAVLVNWKKSADPHGKVTWQPRSAKQLAAITALVKSAIGFNAKRGDTVEVESMRFAADEAPPAHHASPLFGVHLDQADVMQLARTLLIGIIAVLALLLVLKPMVLRLTTITPPLPLAESPESVTALDAEPSAGAQPLGLLADESMADHAQIEGQLRVSSIRRVADLVDQHPAETLSIVRGWMAKVAG